MKTTWFLILFLCLAYCSPAQHLKLTDAQRREQADFIRKDTLPVAIEALPRQVNTRFSEYAGRLFPDSSFYFTSMRADADEDNDHLFETSWYCNIYKTKLGNNQEFDTAEALPAILNTRNTFNSNYCFNKENNLIIYSRCKRDAGGELQCNLWQSELKKKGWSKPQRLSAAINEVGSSNMQPFLWEGTDYNILYFASNRKNGMGGYDLWYAINQNGHYETPVNLGPTINTEGNEVTPFYDEHNRTLYFSSDEHLGIGDYDIFYSQGSLSQWDEVVNMGVPYNSDYNDYYFSLSPDGISGFFSSNRPHDGMDESDTCCNDIFHFVVNQEEIHDTTRVDEPTLADKIASLLPISLYFENDQPDARSTSDTTVTDYLTLYRKYLQAHNLYLEESGHGLTGDTLHNVQNDMIAFLRDSVAAGYERLQQLTHYLQESMQHGDTITLVIKGFASPLHNSDYNKHLSKRRIVSLLNYLQSVNDGYFAPFIRGEKKGLLIKTYPQGAVNHEFSSDKQSETVYGLRAAQDRKIIILQSK